ncbi:MAG: transglutaminase-like domain-containing protein, partial [Cyanobacteria bacterium J06600_6]
MSSELILYRNDWNTAQQRLSPLEEQPDLEQFLKADARIQSEARRIKNLAAALRAENREATVRNIFQFVIDTLQYDNSLQEQRSALMALRTGRGDCTEYTELMIALCRANEIPARYVNGHVVSPHYMKNPRHNWVEVYFDQQGWVAFDPTFADAKNAVTTFDKMLNGYIVISFDRSSRSGWRYGGYSNSFKYQYRSVNRLDEALAEINQLYDNDKLEACRSKVDSLLNAGLTDHRLFLSKAMVNLSEGSLEEALLNLQGALRYAYFATDKLPVYIRLAAYYSLIGNVEFATESLQKVIDEGYHFKRDDYRFMTESGFFSAIADKPFYKSLIAKIKPLFSIATSLIVDYSFLIGQWTENLTQDCSFTNNFLLDIVPGLTQDQVTDEKIKLIKVTRKTYHRELYFNPQGLLI